MVSIKKKKYVKTLFFSIFSKVIIFILGIIIPRLIILNYGSEANGLLSSVGDIYKYIALIEAGVGTAAVQALYKPLGDNDREKVSSVLVATQQYFRKLVRWYALAVLVFSCVYPFIANSDYSYFIVCGVVFVQGISHILTYYFVSTLIQLLSADGREYASQLISLMVFVLNSVIKIVLLYLQVNLVVIQCGYLLVNIIQIVVMYLYIRKAYPWIDWKAQPDMQALSKRNKYMLNGISWVVFSATDTIVLTIICGLKTVSVYSVYNLIFDNLQTVILIFYTSLYFILGQKFHESREEFIKMYDGIEVLLSTLSYALFSVAYVMIIPFISLYTEGADIQYVDKYLPALFALVQILSHSRLLSNQVINTANQPQLINKDSIIDVTINIALSVALALWIGIYGVLLGTIVALIYRTLRLIYVANRKILNRSPWKTYRNYLVNSVLFMAVAVFNYFVKPTVVSYGDFVIFGIIYTIALLMLFLLVNLMLNPQILKVFKKILIQRKVR